MDDSKYKELNDYLNTVLNVLDSHDKLYISNLDTFDYLTSNIRRINKDYKYKECENYYLTCEEVFLLGREIIESINKNYLEEYDSLITSGKLDFSCNNDYYDSHCIFYKKDEKYEININRKFNLTDVKILIHEFMHVTNCNKGVFYNNYLLTEFISIYFEIYALDYLKDKKNYDEKYLNYDERINSTFNNSNDIYHFGVPLIAYNNFGNINDETYILMNKCKLTITKEIFNNDCKKILEYFRFKKNEYFSNIGSEKYYNQHDYENNLISIFSDSYRYFLGTLLAYYAKENTNIKNIINLNDNINNEEMKNQGIIQLLRHFEIIKDSNFLNDMIEIFEKNIEKEKVCRK